MKKTKPMVINGRQVNIRPEKYYWSDFFLVLPAVLLLLLVTYYPVAELIRISFTDWRLTMTTAPEYVGWKNWSCLFNHLTKPFAFMRALIFMPRYIAMSSCGIIFLWILNTDYGVLNKMLEWVGVTNHINWLGDDNLAMVSILMLTGWHGVGYCMMIYLSALLGISSDYYEASSLDGATGLQQFRYITLPLLSPTTLFLFITTFISSMKVYQSVDVMTSGGPRNKTAVMVYYIYDLAFNDNRIDRSAVTALLFFAILLIVTASTMRITNKNVHYEA